MHNVNERITKWMTKWRNITDYKAERTRNLHCMYDVTNGKQNDDF